VILLKINLKNKKNIILINFQVKNTLKNNRYHNINYHLSVCYGHVWDYSSGCGSEYFSFRNASR
jgi:hypothetical protein